MKRPALAWMVGALVLAATIVALVTQLRSEPTFGDGFQDDIVQAAEGSPGVAAMNFRPGVDTGDVSIGPELDVLLRPEATWSQVLRLLERLGAVMGDRDLRGSLPLTVRTPDGDILRPAWGTYADLGEEAPLLADWGEVVGALSTPVTASIDSRASFATDLGAARGRQVQATVRMLSRTIRSGGEWHVTAATTGVALSIWAHYPGRTVELVRTSRRLLRATQLPAGPFAPLGLSLETDGSTTSCAYHFLVPDSIPEGDLTVATHGDVLLPVLTAQALLCDRDHYRAFYTFDPDGPVTGLFPDGRPYDVGQAALWEEALAQAVRHARDYAWWH